MTAQINPLKIHRGSANQRRGTTIENVHRQEHFTMPRLASQQVVESPRRSGQKTACQAKIWVFAERVAMGANCHT